MAVESGRVGARRAQAWGLVSRIIANKDGGGSGQYSQSCRFFQIR